LRVGCPFDSKNFSKGKKMMKNYVKAMALSGLFCGMVCGLGTRGGEKDLDAAVMPGADLVTKFEVKKLLATPFYKEVKDEAKEVEMVRVLNLLGLTVEDLGTGVLALDFDVPVKQGTDDPSATFAVDSAKPWDLQKITAMVILDQGKKKRQVETSTVTLAGKAVTKFKTSPEAAPAGQPAPVGKVEEFFMASAGSVLLVANTEKGMEGALTRQASGVMAPMDPKLVAFCAAMPEAQVRGGIVLPEKLKAKIKGDGKPVQPGPMAPVQESFRNLQQIGWTIACDKDAAIQLKMGLDTKENVDKGVQATLGMIGMIRGMMAMQQGQPQANPQMEMMTELLQGLKIAGKDQDVVVDLVVSSALCKKAQAANQAGQGRQARRPAGGRVIAQPQDE
jgi:hypothetical protein